MKGLNWMLLCVVSVALLACSPTTDRILGVSWMGDGEIAVVNYIDSKGDKRTTRIRCKENNVNVPFFYAWEDDCDLNIEYMGSVHDIDNPEDDRFESRQYTEKSDNRDYRQDDDDGIDGGDLALGVLAGMAISDSGKKKTFKNSKGVTSKPLYKKPLKKVKKSVSRPRKVASRSSSSSSRRR